MFTSVIFTWAQTLHHVTTYWSFVSMTTNAKQTVEKYTKNACRWLRVANYFSALFVCAARWAKRLVNKLARGLSANASVDSMFTCSFTALTRLASAMMDLCRAQPGCPKKFLKNAAAHSLFRSLQAIPKRLCPIICILSMVFSHIQNQIHTLFFLFISFPL